MTSLWLAVLIAALLPCAALLSGMLRWPRDFFAAMLFAQAFMYLFLAPTAVAAELPQSSVSRYGYFLWWGLGLFVIPFLLAYRAILAGFERRWQSARIAYRVRTLPSIVFAAGSVVLGAGYLFVALNRNLLYRRLGSDGLATAQLDLSLLELAFYRGFMEFAPFLAIFSLVVLRVARPSQVWLRVLWRASLFFSGAVYGLHVLVNSRVWGVLFVTALAGLVLLTDREVRRIRPERGVLILLLGLIGLYQLQVTENVRERIASGGSALDPANLLIGTRSAVAEDGYTWRLNGVDLMALIADNVEAQGPALGRAWAVPLLLSLDPIVRTSATEQLKRAALTTSKSFLLLQYAGIAQMDYYSCMLSDAYGNFGVAGFLAVALALASICAFVSAGIRLAAGPAILVVSCFALSRVLPFEQEFSALLFGWLKLAPVVLAVILCNPLATPRTSTARRPALFGATTGVPDGAPA